jgi:hypothetical protein
MEDHNETRIKSAESEEEDMSTASTTSTDQDQQTELTAKGKPRKKRRLKTSDDNKVQKRLEANRVSAAASRQRRLDLVHELQDAVEALSKELKTSLRENRDLKRQLDEVKSVNRQLLDGKQEPAQETLRPEVGGAVGQQRFMFQPQASQSQYQPSDQCFDTRQLEQLLRVQNLSPQKQGDESAATMVFGVQQLQQLVLLQQQQQQGMALSAQRSGSGNVDLSAAATMLRSALSSQQGGGLRQAERFQQNGARSSHPLTNALQSLAASSSANGGDALAQGQPQNAGSQLLGSLLQQSASLVPQTVTSSNNNFAGQSHVVSNELIGRVQSHTTSQDLTRGGQQLSVDLLRLLQSQNQGTSTTKANQGLWKK